MKKILIALLSLAVLFGFAACTDGSDSSSQTLEDLAVVSLAVTEGPDTYFVGDTASVEDYTVVATRANGDTFTVDAKDLNFQVTVPSSATSATAASAKIGTITYTGIYTLTQSPASVDVYATVYNIDAIGVVVKANQPRYYNGSDTTNIGNDYTVTAYALKNATDKADAALYSRELSAEEFSITSDKISSNKFTAAGEAKLTFASKANSKATAISGGSLEATVIVYDDYLASFEVTTDGAAKSAVVGASTDTDPLKYVVVTYTMASGKTGDTSATGATAATAAWAAEITGGTTKFESGKDYKITVTANTGYDAKAESKTVTLRPAENTIVSFNVVASGDINNGDELTGEDFTITPTWLGGSDVAAPAEVTEAVLKQNLLFNGDASYTVPDDYPAGTKLPVTFTLANYPEATCASTISTKAGE